MSDEKPLSAFLRYPEAAALLGISPLTLRGKVSRHQVPFLKPFGPKGRVLFDPDRLRAFVQAGAVEPVE
jgi:excisionase family DNA binding protein